MIPSSSSVLCFVLLMLLFISCKDDNVTPRPQPGGDCILERETTSLSGNEASWTYEYNASGYVVKINRFNKFGSKDQIREISGNLVINSTIPSVAVQLAMSEYKYEGGALIDAHPTRAFLSLTLDDETTVNARTFFFFYDDKGRLDLVGEQTDNVIGDLEWDLHIFYNDQDNVTGMYYEITTGPAGTGSAISVKAYDDKPNPHGGIVNWKFLMNNFAWDNYDPEPVLTALSKNNPLDYALNDGKPGAYYRTMTYEYNDNGYPTKRINTNKNASGEYTFEQTFAYTCK